MERSGNGTLIAISGDQKIHAELDGVVRNKSIYQIESRKLEDVGYYKDWKKCNDKIKNLKNGYKKCKAHKSGNDRKSLSITKNHRILASPMVEPLSLLESNMDEKFDSSKAQLYTDLSENEREWI